MTCRDFHSLWIERAAETMPPEGYAHLQACAACATAVQDDQAADAALRRISALLQPAGAAPDWVKLERALDELPLRRRTWFRPRSIRLAAVGGAAAAAALLVWLGGRHTSSTPRMNANVPIHDAGGAGQANPGPSIPRQGTAHRRLVSVQWARTTPHRPATVANRIRLRSGGPSVDPNGDHHGSAKLASPELAPDARPATALGDPDLQSLNEGRIASAHLQPSPPRPAPSPPPIRLLEARSPGSVVLDDLLNLNPIRVAGAGDAGLSAAVRTFNAEAPATDARLQQRVFVHVTMRRLGDLLDWLSRATGVSLVARLEVADEKISLWAEDQPQGHFPGGPRAVARALERGATRHRAVSEGARGAVDSR